MIDFDNMTNTPGQLAKNAEKIKEINEKAKWTVCKTCKKPIKFKAKCIDVNDKIEWEVIDEKIDSYRYADKHYTRCYPDNFVPKFKEGDRISVTWKVHKTFYLIKGINMDNYYYGLVIINTSVTTPGQKHSSYPKSIPINTIDRKAVLCNGKLIDAIFG